MTTETILTHQQVLDICRKYHPNEDIGLAKAIEQAVLQSEQVQKWKQDSERLDLLESELATVKKVAHGNMDLLDECEILRKDKERLDWLESSKDSHGFCHAGYGDYDYYAHQEEGYPTVREVIDNAMEQKK